MRPSTAHTAETQDPGPALPRSAPVGRISDALSRAAYEAGEIRMIDGDLHGYTHFVATDSGLYAASPNGSRKLAHGMFYGLTVTAEAAYAFEACDRPASSTHRGRIVRLVLAGDRIIEATVFAESLNTGCHQIDIVDGHLCVIDTYAQVVLQLSPNGRICRTIRPLGTATQRTVAGGYAHVNSLLAVGERILLMLHNGGPKTGRPSEIAILDAAWRLVERRPIPGYGCHNIVALEDGTLLTCDSLAGGLYISDGRRVAMGTMMTRGLSVDTEMVVVGGSTFASRAERSARTGTVTFLDRGYRTRATVEVTGAPKEIRRIDGRDISLSANAISGSLQMAPHRVAGPWPGASAG